MPLTLVIGNKNYSSWSLRPWLLLKQYDIPFQEIRLPLDTPQFARDIVRWSPTRRVPVLHDQEIAVWDSLAICEYVNECYLNNQGWPAAASARAMARAVSAEMHSGFEAMRSALPMNCRRRVHAFIPPADALRDIERVKQLWNECRSCFGAQGAFLFGDFSIADAMYAPVVLRFRTYGVALTVLERAYSDAVLALPAIQEWLTAASVEEEAIPATDNIA